MGRGPTFLAIACATTRWCHQLLSAHMQHLHLLPKAWGSSREPAAGWASLPAVLRLQWTSLDLHGISDCTSQTNSCPELRSRNVWPFQSSLGSPLPTWLNIGFKLSQVNAAAPRPGPAFPPALSYTSLPLSLGWHQQLSVCLSVCDKSTRGEFSLQSALGSLLRLSTRGQAENWNQGKEGATFGQPPSFKTPPIVL